MSRKVKRHKRKKREGRRKIGTWPTPEMPKPKQYFALGKIEKVPARVVTDAGPQESRLNGEILFLMKPTKKGVQLSLTRMNLQASSIKCKEDESGLLSLGLVKSPERLRYSRGGEVQIDFKMNLHYPLIDKIKGYRPMKEKEQDDFVPYVATVSGRLKGKFEPPLEAFLEEFTREKEPKKPLTFTADTKLLAKAYYVKEMTFELAIVVLVAITIENELNIQPVFIRSAPTDPSPTGWSFDTMMQSAKCIWRKCCVHFKVLDPIYVDDASYKELNSSTEASNLRGEVNIQNAVEIFVVDHMTTTLYQNWGGGATWGSGTANAKIVTCDEQLKVPHPSNPGTYLGAINVNHVAHELGHVMALRHPGATVSPPMTAAGTPNTVMEPSGFYADNPHQQSQHNCSNVANPLFHSRLVFWDYRCRPNPEIV